MPSELTPKEALPKLTPSDVLQKVKAILAATHWTKGIMKTHDPTGKVQYCLIGAIREVVLGNMGELGTAATISQYKLYADVKRALWRILGGSVMDFNDRPETTLDDVLRVIDEAMEVAA